MKWHSIIVSGLFVLLCLPLRAQQSYADSLLALEMQYFYAEDSLQKENYLLQKCNLHSRRQQVTTAALLDFERVNENQLSTEQLANLCWNKALCNYVLGNAQSALHNIKRFKTLTADSTTETEFMFTLCVRQIDSALFQQQINKLKKRDEAFSNLQAFTKLAVYEKKHRAAYLLASAIVPGAGSVALGYPVKGLTSTAISAASIYALVELSKYNLYANAILWGTGFGLKFYFGNIALTEKLFDKKEQRQRIKLETTCKQAVSNLLEIYPLQLQQL